MVSKWVITPIYHLLIIDPNFLGHPSRFPDVLSIHRRFVQVKTMCNAVPPQRLLLSLRGAVNGITKAVLGTTGETGGQHLFF